MLHLSHLNLMYRLRLSSTWIVQPCNCPGTNNIQPGVHHPSSHDQTPHHLPGDGQPSRPASFSTGGNGSRAGQFEQFPPAHTTAGQYSGSAPGPSSYRPQWLSPQTMPHTLFLIGLVAMGRRMRRTFLTADPNPGPPPRRRLRQPRGAANKRGCDHPPILHLITIIRMLPVLYPVRAVGALSKTPQTL